MKTLLGFFCGLLFGIGLVVSGMGHPEKVLNFLDVFGAWDPSLAFVMGGAVITAFFGYRVVLKRTAPMLADAFHLPTKTDLDARLLSGAGVFGVGWGLGGLCPGPAFASTLPALLSTQSGIIAFFIALLIGMWAGRIVPEQFARTA